MGYEVDQAFYAFKPINDNPIFLDFSKCHYAAEIHELLKERFGFPDYYGENWDALWDCLDGLFEDVTPRYVEIHGYYKMPKELREYCNPMLKVFDDVHKKTPNVIFKLIS